MSVIFTHPYGVNTLVLRMRSPEFGDDEILGLNTRFKVAMDGTDYSYRATPSSTSFNLSFTNLTRRKAMELRNFLMTSASEEIGYVGHDGRTWRGKLLIEAGELITAGTGPGDATMRKEDTSITLQFEGELIT